MSVPSSLDRLEEVAARVTTELARLQDVNAELMDACKSVLDQYGGVPCHYDRWNHCETHEEDCWQIKIRVALAKAKGDPK